MLGGVPTAQSQIAEAEPLLVDGCRGRKHFETGIAPEANVSFPEALERLARLYESKGNQPEAAACLGKFEAAREQQAKPEGK